MTILYNDWLNGPRTFTITTRTTIETLYSGLVWITSDDGWVAVSDATHFEVI